VFAILPLLCAVGCAELRSVRPPKLQEPLEPQKRTEERVSVLPLSADERVMERNVARHVQYLTVRIGERNPAHPWELASAADYLAEQLEQTGLAPERQGYETDGIMALNLTVTLPGSSRGEELVVLGTHYDSPPGKVGESEAEQVAVLLELARNLRGAGLARTVRIAFFALGAGAHGANRGSVRFASQLDDVRPSAVVVFEPHRTPIAENDATHTIFRLDWSHNAEGISRTFAEGIAGDPFVVEGSVLALGAQDSDANVFAERGFRTLRLSTARHTRTEDLARLVGRLRFALRSIAGARQTNDNTLTPDPRAVR